MVAANRKRGLALLLVLALLLMPVPQASAEEVLEVPDGSGEAAVPEKPEEPGEPEQPEEPQQPDDPAQPAEPEVPEEPENPEQPEEPEESEQPNQPEQPEEPQEPEEPEQPEKPEQPEDPVEPEEPEQPEGSGESEIPGEAEVPENPEEAEELEEPEAAGIWSLSRPLAIGDVLQLSPGEEPVLTTGTVVFADGLLAVLQDDTGGIRLSFPSPPEIAPGDILLVSGHRSDGLAVAEFEKTGTGDLPVLEATLAEGLDGVRVLLKGAVLEADSLTQNGCSCVRKGTLPEGLVAGDRVDAWGVLLDGEFYADTITASTVPEAPRLMRSLSSSWNFYFGQLHAHTDLSGAYGSVEDAFHHASQADNLDFFAVTEHSNSLDNAMAGSLNADGRAISDKWKAGKRAAEAVTDGAFVGIFGYEMTWPADLAIGHINTFGTSGWLTRDQPGMNTLAGYLDALGEAPDAISQFNHPGGSFGNFQSFRKHSPQHDARVQLMEISAEIPFDAYGTFVTALDRGWHLAPSNNQNNHEGNWGSASPSRTVVLARELTEAAIYDAVRNHRVYAAEDANLQIEYRLNGQIMGSILGGGESLTADISITDGSGDAVGQVEVITNGGQLAASATIQDAAGSCSLELAPGGSYYFVRVLRSGNIAAVTAPVWVDSYGDLGIAEFTPEEAKPIQGTRTSLILTLFNNENLPFVVENVTFSAGTQILQELTAPGSVAALGELEIPLTYYQETAGAVTITATVTGTIGGLPRSCQETATLHYQPLKAELLPIGQVRQGLLGEAYRIRGYVTAGTAKPCNSFPGSIYLQDDSGGIQITDFTAEGIQVGAPLEIEGILRSTGGNLVLALTDHTVLQEDYYRYVPVTMAHEEAMDYEAHGGQLLQIEGHVISLTKTADQKGLSRFTIRDVKGDLATVVIENGIGSGAYGTNELASEIKASRMVRAMGLLHIDEYGKTVLRVRNCDEVVYVPPKKDPTNPQTGDWLQWLKSRK